MKNIKKAYLCKNGPMMGEKLFLHPDGCTAIFTYRGETGSYRNGNWVPV